MDFNTAAIVCLGGMLFLLMTGIPIAYSIGFVSALVGYLAFGESALDKVGWTTYTMLYKLSWTPLPVFTLLACLMAQTSMGEDIFGAARRWLSPVPGGLVASTVFGEAVMAAALGSSTATIMAMGKVAEPEFRRNKYNLPYAIGATLAGGVLGPLIPPSTIMIIFAVMANAPLGELFIAGVVPGIMLAVMLAGLAILMAWRKPSLGPRAEGVSWRERFSSLKRVWPMVLIMIAILGSIYAGIATPTEAGGVGCFVVLVLAITVYGMRWKGLLAAMKETAVLNAMIMFVMVSANFFAYVVGSSDLTEAMTNWVTAGNIAPVGVIVILMIIMLVMGCFMDGITIMMLTVPFFVPLVTGLGYDLVWLGVLYTVNMEVGLITPPMGLNLFVARQMFNLKTGELIKGVLPFLITLFVFLFLLVFVPDIVLWLPSLMD
jgi:C4-dicarboxylate transporter DctM subunit